MRSWISRAGSPKNWSAPCSSRTSRRRWIAPTEADATLPYFIDNSLLRSPTLIAIGPEVGKVEHRHAFILGDAEHDVQHAFLGLVEFEQPGEKKRPHVGDGGADRVALFTEHIPQHGRIGARREGRQADLIQALVDEVLLGAGDRNAGEVTLDVGGKDRDAGIGEAFGQDLQGDGLAGAGRARDQAVAVGEFQVKIFWLDALADENFAVLEHDCPLDRKKCPLQAIQRYR